MKEHLCNENLFPSLRKHSLRQPITVDNNYKMNVFKRSDRLKHLSNTCRTFNNRFSITSLWIPLVNTVQSGTRNRSPWLNNVSDTSSRHIGTTVSESSRRKIVFDWFWDNIRPLQLSIYRHIYVYLISRLLALRMTSTHPLELNWSNFEMITW